MRDELEELVSLKKNEIPFVFIGGLSLFERTHIKNLFSALKIIVNHKDELAWFRFLKLWPNIGDKTAMTFYKEVSRCSSWKEVGKLLRSLMGHFPAMVMGLEKMKKYEHNVHQTVKTAIEMLEEIMHKELEEDPEKRDDWDVLLSMAEYEPNLGDFIGTCSIDPEYDLKAEAQREGCLRLMTVHSAKGTEAKVCFLIAVDPHSYPHRKSQDAEEERRILYVAMTRAMDELILTRSGSPFGSDPFMEGNHVPCGDYLLNELPHILIGYQSIN